MEHVPVRVNGPMGGESILAQGYDHLLMIAGGVAVSMHHCFLTLFCAISSYLSLTQLPLRSVLCSTQSPSIHIYSMIFCVPS